MRLHDIDNAFDRGTCRLRFVSVGQRKRQNPEDNTVKKTKAFDTQKHHVILSIQRKFGLKWEDSALFNELSDHLGHHAAQRDVLFPNRPSWRPKPSSDYSGPSPTR